VVGEKEQANRTVNVRTRDNKVHGEFSLESVLQKFGTLATERVIKSEDYGWSEQAEVTQLKVMH
jgi:threonyl-tRNA synthetase